VRWWVYMLRCADSTLYTGITTDLARRLLEHNGKRAGGARYTRARRPVTLHYKEAAPDRSTATRREAALRRLSRREKLGLVTTRRVPRAGSKTYPGAGLLRLKRVA